MSTPDQRELWIAACRSEPAANRIPSTFVATCLEHLPDRSHILELGCGNGTDAEALARARHRVHATDFVPAVIAANRERLATVPNLTFEEVRIDEPYPFENAAFGAVYAHLTLHYFPHHRTRSILQEIHRVLVTGGLLMFACKSPADPAYGRGIEIEPDMFDLHGKVRHFFSERYARELLADGFEVILLETHQGRLYRQRAGWITVIARSIPHATSD